MLDVRATLLKYWHGECFFRLLVTLLPFIFIPHLFVFFDSSLNFNQLNPIVCAVSLVFALWIRLCPGRCLFMQQQRPAGDVHSISTLLVACELFLFGLFSQSALLSLYRTLEELAGVSAIFVAAYSILLAVLLIALSPIALGFPKEEEAAPCSSLSLVAYSAGSLICRLYESAAGEGLLLVDYLSFPIVLLIPLVLLPTARLAFAWIVLSSPSACGEDGSPNHKCASALESDMRRAGLTDRELQVVALLLQGCSSKESASELGIRPSTVREYLRRSYKKLEVADSAELIKKLECDRLTSERRRIGNAPGLSRKKSNGEEAEIRTSLFLAGITLCLLPNIYSVSIWPFEYYELVSTAAALVLAGFLAPLIATLDKGRSLHPGIRLLCMVLLLLGMVGANKCSGVMASVAFLIDTIALGVLLSSMLAVLSEIFESSFAPAAYIGIVAVSILGSCLSPLVDVAVARFLIIVAAAVPPYGKTATSIQALNSLDNDNCINSVRIMSAITFCITLGVAVEEIWRAGQTYSFIMAAVVFSFLICPSLLRIVLLNDSSEIVGIGSIAAVLVIIAFAQHETFSICLLCFDMVLIVRLASVIRLQLPVICAFVQTFALGVYLGVAGATGFGRWLNQTTLLFGSIAARDDARAVAEAVAIVVFALIGLYYARCLWRVRPKQISAFLTDASDEMVIDYLKKLGLTTLQVNVVTLLVEGADVETIAKELNYSESMIRQVRATCYRLFSVTDGRSLRRVVLSGLSRSQP